MKTRRSAVRGIICVLGVLVFAAVALADALIEGSASSRDDQVITVSFRVANAFTPEMERAILSGIPHTFTFYFEIYRVITAWPDLRIYHWQVRRTVHYDTLKKTFSVDLGDGNPPKHTDNLIEAKKWMVEFTDLPVAVTTSLDRSNAHYLRVKAELDPVKLPLMLNKVFFFINLWSFETPWHRIDLPVIEAADDAL